ncbi:nitroreductase [Methanosphaera sp. WGK6]|uniref:nitroreductase family protein n=1 Tax=Methanosphaera sp. WGK6 TaxID=1561964 RepID=UPI00084C4399|nr:nitroreductase [Methanosphaera sp. WGK6]OED29826.1 diguanylate cyclase [Methanosphaera sp. WGK6]
MENIDLFKTRRSIRNYSDKQVSKDDLEKILEAGTYAPNGMGSQSPKILVTQDKELIDKLEEMNKSFFPPQLLEKMTDVKPFYGAPTLVIVLADKNHPTGLEDASLVLGNILNAAHALGIGGRWIHRAREEFDSPEGKELLKTWNIPDNYIGVGHAILGYPADDSEVQAAPRKDDYITYIDEL